MVAQFFASDDNIAPKPHARSKAKTHYFLHTPGLSAFAEGGDVHLVIRNAVGPGMDRREEPEAGQVPREALERLRELLTKQMEDVASAYGRMLRESLPTGENVEVKAALNRVRVQEKLLANVAMVDQAQACELLGMSASNPSATMKRKEDRRELLRFTVEGRPVYPLFQFDIENRAIFPVMRALIAAAPERWSPFRLLHWLTRPHVNFESTPAAALGSDPEGVMAAFAREIEPSVHG